MTTLSFRVEQKPEGGCESPSGVSYASGRVQVQRGCGGQNFNCLWLGTDASAVSRFREVSGTAAHPEVTMRRSYRKHSRQKIGNHRRQSRKPEIRVRESDPVPPKRLPPQKSSSPIEGYDLIVSELVDLVESARRFSARSVNAVMTATYWEIGRRIVEVEQRGKKRAEYGEALLKKRRKRLKIPLS